MRTIRIGGLDGPGDAQHAVGIAAVEGKILVELDRGEIARPAVDDLCANGLHGRHIPRDPVSQLADQQGLPLVGPACRLGAPEIGRRHDWGGLCLEEHPGETGIDIGQDRAGIGIGSGHDVGGFGFVGEKAGDEIVDAG